MNLKKVKERMDHSLANAMENVERKAKKQYNKVVGKGKKKREDGDETTEWDESRDQSRMESRHSPIFVPTSIDDSRMNEMQRRNEELERRNEAMRKEMVEMKRKMEWMEHEKKEGEKRYRRVLILLGRRG